MAKPIEAGIELTGKDAIRFIERMLKESRNPDPVRLAFIRETLAIKDQLKPTR